MRASIIIPTYNHLDDYLKPCLEAIYKYTTMDDVEVIVVANGCSDGTREFLALSKYPNLHTIWSDLPIGYTKASNEGAKAAMGDYFIFLNNDAFITESPKDQWIDYLLDPFNKIPNLGATGPLTLPCGDKYEFIVGFCMATPKKLFWELGGFNEIYSPGAGEDTEYCIELQKKGYLIKAVPNSEKKLDPVTKLWINQFPIYHKAEGTMHDENTSFGELGKGRATWEKIFARNTKILHDKYPDIYNIKVRERELLCEICTKNRYRSTLPMTISSVLNQTLLPDHITIYDDSDPAEDMRNIPFINALFQTMDRKGIGWNVVFGPKKGQTHNHQSANEQGWKYVWRIDDDEVAEHDVLEALYNYIKSNPNTGAVGGVVPLPTANGKCFSRNKIEEVYSEPNMQWYIYPEGTAPVQVDHLFSSFLYRAGIVDYDLNCPGLHREETIFSYEFRHMGMDVVVLPAYKTWHYRNPEGGIRKEPESKFNADELNFEKRLRRWGIGVVVLDNGLGDHYAFKNILPDLQKKYKKIILACCYPEVFKGVENINITPIAAVPGAVRDKYNIYKWMAIRNWDKHIEEAFKEMYGTN